MAKVIQMRRGTTAEHTTFIGAPGEITVDTTKKVVVVHDGVTPGGFPANLGTNPSFGGTATFTGQLRVTGGVASTSTTTGSLLVTGGVGVTGAVYCGPLVATTITETSSIALKENVEPLTGALESISKLVGVIYDRKDKTSKDEAGFIAEQVNEVMPNLVTKDDKGNPYGVQYTKIIAYLVEAVKEQQRQIDDLKKKV